MPRRAPSRLADVDPIEIAREVSARVARDYAKVARALGVVREVPGAVERTPVYRRVLALAAYAIGGAAMPREPAAEVTWLVTLLRLPMLRGEPHSPLEAVILAAQARDALAHREPLSAAQLALLAGVDRDSVLARASDLPGAYRSDEPRKPWRFLVTGDLLTWLSAREAATQRATARVA